MSEVPLYVYLGRSLDHIRALGICLMQGPRGARFLMCEVLLCLGRSVPTRLVKTKYPTKTISMTHIYLGICAASTYVYLGRPVTFTGVPCS